MGNTDIILDRIKQRKCPICLTETRPEWKDKYKPVLYKGVAVLVCREHYIPGDKIKKETQGGEDMDWNAIIQEVCKREGGKEQINVAQVSEVVSHYNKLILEKTSIDILEVMKKTK